MFSRNIKKNGANISKKVEAHYLWHSWGGAQDQGSSPTMLLRVTITLLIAEGIGVLIQKCMHFIQRCMSKYKNETKSHWSKQRFISGVVDKARGIARTKQIPGHNMGTLCLRELLCLKMQKQAGGLGVCFSRKF